MVENPNIGPKFYAQLPITASVFPHNLVDWLASWNEFKVNSALAIEESDEHCLHL
jgi:hypothetical protein